MAHGCNIRHSPVAPYSHITRWALRPDITVHMEAQLQVASHEINSMSERISEHERDLRMQYFDKSAVAQHALENNHHIGFDEARLIDRVTNYWDRIRREAIEIKLQPNN